MSWSHAREVRLRALFARRDFTGRPDLPLLSVYRDYGVVPREGREDNYNKPGENLDAYRVVQCGDLVLNKMKTWQGSLGISSHEGIVSPAYFVARPLTDDCPAFLHHLLRSLPLIAEYAARSKGIRPSQWDLPWEEFQNITVKLPSPATQRAIAEYVDGATARIDALITARRRMHGLLQERSTRLFESTLNERGFRFPTTLVPNWAQVSLPVGWRVIRLSQTLLRLTNGYVGPTRDILRDDGIRYVQSMHIKGGKIEFGRRPFFVDEEWHSERPRINLKPNDVLIVQTGDIGQVAVVPEGLGEASCHALQIARVNPRILSGRYLASYLRSSFGYNSLLSRATGALHPHLEAGIRDVPVVVPPADIQSSVLDEVEQEQGPLAQMISAVERQSNLLYERRRALIAATVTGQRAIPGAA